MELLPQFLVNGIMLGGIYALLALGIVVIYKTTRLFNFAVGQLMVVGAYLCWTLMTVGLSPWLAIFIGLILAALLGFLIQRLAINPLIGQPLLAGMMATLALVYVFQGIELFVWKGIMRTFPHFLPGGPVKLGTVTMSHELLWAFLLALLAVGITGLLFQRTEIGLGMRASSEDQQLAQARGIPVRQVFIVSWMLAAVIAVFGGIILGVRLGLSPDLANMGLKAFPAVLLGGLESIPGAIIGGLIIGLVESLTGGLISPELGAISPFIILILVLMFKTEGLFGLERIERI